jgi:hypothetical protein
MGCSMLAEEHPTCIDDGRRKSRWRSSSHANHSFLNHRANPKKGEWEPIVPDLHPVVLVHTSLSLRGTGRIRKICFPPFSCKHTVVVGL